MVSSQNPAAAELVGRTVITQKCSNNDPRTMVRIVIEAGEIALRTQITNQCSQKVAFTLNAYYRWCPDGQCKPWKKCGLEWNNPFRVDAGASETRKQCSSVGNNEWKIDSTKVEFVGPRTSTPSASRSTSSSSAFSAGAAAAARLKRAQARAAKDRAVRQQAERRKSALAEQRRIQEQRNQRRAELRKKQQEQRRTNAQTPVKTGLRGTSAQLKRWDKRLKRAQRRGGYQQANRELQRIKQEERQREKYRKRYRQDQKRFKQQQREYKAKQDRKWKRRWEAERQRNERAAALGRSLARSCSQTGTCEYMQLIASGALTAIGLYFFTSASIKAAVEAPSGRDGGEYDPAYKLAWTAAFQGLTYAFMSDGPYKRVEPRNFKTYAFGFHGNDGIWESMKEAFGSLVFSTGIGPGFDHYRGLVASPIFEYDYGDPSKSWQSDAGSVAHSPGYQVDTTEAFVVIPFILRAGWLRLAWYSAFGEHTQSTKYELGVQPFGQGLISPFFSIMANLEMSHISDETYFVDRDAPHLLFGNTFHLLNFRSPNGYGISGLMLQVAYAKNLFEQETFGGRFERDDSYIMFSLGVYNGWDY